MQSMRFATFAVVIICRLVRHTQNPEDEDMTFHSTSSLVLIDVIAQDPGPRIGAERTASERFRNP